MKKNKKETPKKTDMEPQITASFVSQIDQNSNPSANTNHHDSDLCPVHETELTKGFCEFCQVCYSCK